MDKFVTAKKSTIGTLNGGKQESTNKTDRQKFRYNPYSVSRGEERKFEDWKGNKRTEKSI